MDAQVCYLSTEISPEDGITIAEHVARELVKRKSLSQLLPAPFRGGMCGRIEVDNTTPVMSQHQKNVKDLETNGGHSKGRWRPVA